MAVMSEEITRCPHCGVIQGGAVVALDALYGEVVRLRQLAERPPPLPDEEHALKGASAREAALLREIRLLQETVARLRGSAGSAAGSLCYGYLTYCLQTRQ
jgi:hypothetical protein